MSAGSAGGSDVVDCDSLESIYQGLGERNVPEPTVYRFKQLLSECAICSVTALRLFSESLPDLANEMYDMQSALGKLKASGFVANVRVRCQQGSETGLRSMPFVPTQPA